MNEKPYLNRPFLRIFFECCQIYQRIYRHTEGHSYKGRCPRCLRTIEFRIGPGGTAARAFSVR